MLLSCFGGITERWHEPEEENWLCNLKSALCEDESKAGFNEWEDNFFEFCSWDNLTPDIEPKDYIAFAFEANGNCTVYHKVTGQVLMYAHDHCFEHITSLEGCPEYTLYRINDCPDIRWWVETVARQWLNHVDIIV